MAAVTITIPRVAVNPFEREFIRRSEAMAAKQQLAQVPPEAPTEPGVTPPGPIKQPFFTPRVRQYLVGLGLLGAVAGLVWAQQRG